MLGLEEHFHGELQNARVVCTRNLSEVRRAEIRAQRAEARARRLSGRSEPAHEVGVVEDIERLSARLQTESLGKLESPAQCQIEREDTRPTLRIASNVAIGAGRILNERLRIEPLDAN